MVQGDRSCQVRRDVQQVVVPDLRLPARICEDERAHALLDDRQERLRETQAQMPGPRVVLHLLRNDRPHLDVLLDVTLFEGLLQYFKVLEELPLVASTPVDLIDLDLAGEHCIEYLAVYGSCAELLNLADSEIEEAVGPPKQIGFWDEECTFHHANALVGHLNAV